MDINSSISAVWERLALANPRETARIWPCFLSLVSAIWSLPCNFVCGRSQMVEVEAGWEDQMVWGRLAGPSGSKHSEMEKVREKPLRWRRWMYEVRWKGWVCLSLKMKRTRRISLLASATDEGTERLELDCPQRCTATGQEATRTGYSRGNANEV